jgi:hypothetical protein
MGAFAMSKNALPGDDITDVVDSPKSVGAMFVAMALLVAVILIACWFTALPTGKDGRATLAKIDAPASNMKAQNISDFIIGYGVLVVGGIVLFVLPRVVAGGYNSNAGAWSKETEDMQRKEASWRVMHNSVINAHGKDAGLPPLDVHTGFVEQSHHEH